MAVVKTHGTWPEAPWKPLAPRVAFAYPEAWNVFLHVSGSLPTSTLGASRRSGGLGFPRPCYGRERASFPRRRLDLLVLTDLSRFCGTAV